MLLQLSCVGRAQPEDLRSILPALAEATNAPDLDHSRLSAVLDWVQYRKNFRAPVMVRPFGREAGQEHDGPLAEIAIDVRRAKDIPHDELVAQIADRVRKALGLIPDVHECIHLEEWVRPSKSVVWSFNHSYWRHLAAWDETFAKDYAAALPGGVSDGTNPQFWADQIEAFVDVLDHLEEWSELPDEIPVLEFGVGDGQQAKVWLETFAAQCAARGRDYLSRVRYVLADYSPHVLERARQALTDFADQVECLELDFRNPVLGLGDFRGKVLFAHACNLYDNLPTDELMRVGDHAYEPLVRASITPAEVQRIASTYDVPEGDIVAAVQQVLREDPAATADVARGVRFWADVWDAVHLEEIYVDIPATTALKVAPSADVHLNELVADLPEWTRVHMSTVAVESFAQTLQLLHHEGTLVAQDIFVHSNGDYSAFRGPGKLEGSILNWLNGPIFQLVGERSGYRVTIEPFAYREKSLTSVLVTRHRDAYSRPRGDAATAQLAGTV